MWILGLKGLTKSEVITGESQTYKKKKTGEIIFNICAQEVL